MWCVPRGGARAKRRQIEEVPVRSGQGVSWLGVVGSFLVCHFVVDAFKLDVAASR